LCEGCAPLHLAVAALCAHAQTAEHMVQAALDTTLVQRAAKVVRLGITLPEGCPLEATTAERRQVYLKARVSAIKNHSLLPEELRLLDDAWRTHQRDAWASFWTCPALPDGAALTLLGALVLARADGSEAAAQIASVANAVTIVARGAQRTLHDATGNAPAFAVVLPTTKWLAAMVEPAQAEKSQMPSIVWTKTLRGEVAALLVLLIARATPDESYSVLLINAPRERAPFPAVAVSFGPRARNEGAQRAPQRFLTDDGVEAALQQLEKLRRAATTAEERRAVFDEQLSDWAPPSAEALAAPWAMVSVTAMLGLDRRYYVDAKAAAGKK